MTAREPVERTRSTIGEGQAARLVSDLYAAHAPWVHRAARHICGDDLAWQVTHDVFLWFLVHPESYDPSRGSIRTLLMTTAKSRAIDTLRSDERRHSREELVERAGASSFESADAAILRREALDRLAAAIGRLPDAERQAVTMAFYEEQTYRAAAQALQTPEGTVKSRIRSALRHLAADLGSEAD
jgi:RNA polymerase sigma factor (sigma-70 family)